MSPTRFHRTPGCSPRLLVSVRSAAEGRAALQGGVDIIDVKEPAHGALGRADDGVMAAVVGEVGGRAMVTAALGELRALDVRRRVLAPGVRMAKLGLAGTRDAPEDWRERWLRARRMIGTGPSGRPRHPDLALVAYADAERAGAPPVEKVIRFALTARPPVLLIDTLLKDGRTLLDWLDTGVLENVARRVHAAGVALALAGSLGPVEIAEVLATGADVIAVRGATCRRGTRESEIDAAAVADLARLIRSRAAAVATPEAARAG